MDAIIWLLPFCFLASLELLIQLIIFLAGRKNKEYAETKYILLEKIERNKRERLNEVETDEEKKTL